MSVKLVATNLNMTCNLWPLLDKVIRLSKQYFTVLWRKRGRLFDLS